MRHDNGARRRSLAGARDPRPVVRSGVWNVNTKTVAETTTPPLAEQATELVARLGQSLSTMAGLALPPHALVKLQGEYLAESTALWNRLLSSSTEPSAPAKPDR